MPKIVFFLEGVNGCGKSTVSQMLKDTLPYAGINATFTKQSTVDFNALYGAESLRETPEVAQQLYMADRMLQFKQWADTYSENSSAVIICDRGPLSAYAYNRPFIHHGGITASLMTQNLAALRLLHEFNIHQIIFLLPTSQAQSRVAFRRNEKSLSASENFEMAQANEFYTNLQSNRDRPHGPYTFINAAEPVEAVAKKVKKIIESQLESLYCHERYPSNLQLDKAR